MKILQVILRFWRQTLFKYMKYVYYALRKYTPVNKMWKSVQIE